MRLTTLEQKIADIISPVMQDLGMDLLWVEYKAGILGIYAENPKTGKLTLEECTRISNEISPLLEVEDPIEGAYRLEVSSAGIDRPLFNKNDYERFHDLEVKIELDEAIEGQKKFRGYIRGTSEDTVQLETDQGAVDLPFVSIYKAKLVMTDELIKETKKRFELANNNEPTQEVLTETN
ncbi:MAG TPA: ribosome maturation factor RimP [Alphaproteobacteria bacterium]|nr:ribosome maturation factor RimP [Alphaproteobacteria bacterium]